MITTLVTIAELHVNNYRLRIDIYSSETIVCTYFRELKFSLTVISTNINR